MNRYSEIIRPGFRIRFLYGLWKTLLKVDGLKGIIKGIDLYRAYEYPTVFHILKNLSEDERGVILDIGSNRSVFVPFLALSLKGYFKRVIATDVDDSSFGASLNWQHKAKSKLSLKNLEVRFCDARTLMKSLPEYYKGNVNVITAISTLEHLESNGDIEAGQQIGQILAPSGLCIITLPFGKSFKCSERRGFFERVYDKKNLSKRIVIPSKLKIISTRFFGAEGKISDLYSRMYTANSKISYFLTRALRIVLFPLFPYMIGEVSQDKAGGVLLVMKKL